MTTANPLRRLDGRAKPYARLVLAVLLSATVHGALIFAVRVAQIERPGEADRRLQVRLMDMDQPAAREEKPAVLLRAIDKAAPAVRPEPEPSPSIQPVEPRQAKPPDARPGMPEQAAGATTLDIPVPADDTYYPAREVDSHPSLVSGGKPVYPDEAGRGNIKGEVTVLMMLNEDGAADAVSIVNAKPEGMGFEEAVITWLRDARFKPALRKGRAVKARVVYHVTFDSEEGPPTKLRGEKK